MNFDDYVKACKDSVFRQRYRYDADLITCPYVEAFPLLTAKIRTYVPGEEARFTPDEKREREELCESLFDAMLQIIRSALDEMIREAEGQQSDPEPPDDRSHDLRLLRDLRMGLYLLARCGDESAFLELTALDGRFCQNWLFQQSLMVWREQAGKGNERAMNILRRFSQAVVVPLPKAGRPRHVNPDIYIRYVAIKLDHPDKPDSAIYRIMARESLKNTEREAKKEAIERETARIKKEFQSPNLWCALRYEQTGEVSPQALKNWENSIWRFFRYFRKEL